MLNSRDRSRVIFGYSRDIRYIYIPVHELLNLIWKLRPDGGMMRMFRYCSTFYCIIHAFIHMHRCISFRYARCTTCGREARGVESNHKTVFGGYLQKKEGP